MSDLNKILADLNNLTDEEKKKLNERIMARNNQHSDDPVESIKKSIAEISTIEVEDYKKNRVQGLVNKINNRNLKKVELLKDSSYFEWLLNKCKENERMSSDFNDYHEELSPEESEMIYDIGVFYDAVSDYASEHNISYYEGDDATSARYHVKYNYDILTIYAFIFGGGVVCHKTEEFELRLDNEEAIDLNDIIKYYRKKAEKEDVQRVR